MRDRLLRWLDAFGQHIERHGWSDFGGVLVTPAELRCDDRGDFRRAETDHDGRYR